MHDLDRTQVGFCPQLESFEYEFGETEMGETEIMELAGELLELSSEQEFENFLGDLINKAGSAIKNFANSSTGKALGGMLKDAAKKALPIAGQAIGGYFGGSAGSQIGGQLGQAASNLFEAEASEYESEEREWEAATNYVKLATDAAKIAAQAAPGSNPVATARQALTEAARTHAPYLVNAIQPNGAGARPAQIQGGSQPQSQAGSQAQTQERKTRSGRWVRHHNRIVLLGI
jgi:hypothetical protein